MLKIASKDVLSNMIKQLGHKAQFVEVLTPIGKLRGLSDDSDPWVLPENRDIYVFILDVEKALNKETK